MGISSISPGLWVKDSDDLNRFRGDLIEFERENYSHWAMYIGKWNYENDMVVHFNPKGKNEKAGISWVDGIVTVAKLKDVAGSSRTRMNNMIDESPRTWQDIEYKIEKLENRDGCRYSLADLNCEHFVTYLRYPVTSGFSYQTRGGFWSWFTPTWHIGTYDNGGMQTEQWNEYVKAAEERRQPKNTMPV